MTNRVTHLGAAAAWEAGDGILAVTFTGPITAASLPALKRSIAARAPVGDLRAVVADYSGASLLLDDDALVEMMAGDDPSNLPGLPAAVVIRSEHFDRLADAAMDAGFLRGLARVVLLRLDQALLWAAGQTRAGS